MTVREIELQKGEAFQKSVWWDTRGGPFGRRVFFRCPFCNLANEIGPDYAIDARTGVVTASCQTVTCSLNAPSVLRLLGWESEFLKGV